MRSEKELKAELEHLDKVIKFAKDARDIFTMPGGDKVVAFLKSRQADYEFVLNRLDAYSDRLAMDYAKHQFVINEFKKLVGMLSKAQEEIERCEKAKIAIGVELKKLKDERERIERNRM